MGATLALADQGCACAGIQGGTMYLCISCFFFFFFSFTQHFSLDTYDSALILAYAIAAA